METVAASIKQTCQALGLGRTTVYQLIKAGRLRTTKIGSRTLVTVESVRAIVAADAPKVGEASTDSLAAGTGGAA